MTQLFINDIEIALSDNFSFQQTDENPIITSVGEFTLDIVISLQMGMNARAFGMVHRMNKTNIPKEWTAYMIVNNKVSYGKAIYVSNTDISVTIQFVAGNSELQYFAQQDTKIWQMDWGTETPIDYTRARQSINQVGYQSGAFHFVCAPLKLKDTIVNNFTLANETGASIPSTAFPINGVGKIIMQPYLLHYIDKMAEMFGFTIKENVLLTDNRAQCTYLLNNYDSLKYADALPDIKLSEFIQLLEDTFNVMFIVDKTNQTLSITYRHNQITSRPTFEIKNVIDTYTRNLSDESDDKLMKFGIGKLTYNLPDDLYYKYHKFDNYWMLRVFSIFKTSFAEIKSQLISALPDAYYNQAFVFFDELDDYYFYAPKPSLDLFSRKITSSRSVYMFNKFKDTNAGTGNLELELDMIPPIIEKATITTVYLPGTPDAKEISINYQLPISNKEITEASNFTAIPIADMVEQDKPNNNRSSDMETAIFMGIIKAYVTSPNQSITFSTLYPFSCNDFYPDFGENPSSSDVSRFETWALYDFGTSAPGTYRLNSLMTSYAKNKYFDSSKEYVMQMEDSPLLSTSFLFEIGNAIYIPIRFERTISNKEEMVTGYFYKML